MHHFNLDLVLGQDPNTDMPVFGFERNSFFIFDPMSSECSRFIVDPTENYGISKEDAAELARLNKLIETATQVALNAGCLSIQDAVGISHGDFAGIHFSGNENAKPIADALAKYLFAEYEHANAAFDN